MEREARTTTTICRCCQCLCGTAHSHAPRNARHSVRTIWFRTKVFRLKYFINFDFSLFCRSLALCKCLISVVCMCATRVALPLTVSASWGFFSLPHFPYLPFPPFNICCRCAAVRPDCVPITPRIRPALAFACSVASSFSDRFSVPFNRWKCRLFCYLLVRIFHAFWYFRSVCGMCVCVSGHVCHQDASCNLEYFLFRYCIIVHIHTGRQKRWHPSSPSSHVHTYIYKIYIIHTFIAITQYIWFPRR